MNDSIVMRWLNIMNGSIEMRWLKRDEVAHWYEVAHWRSGSSLEMQ